MTRLQRTGMSLLILAAGSASLSLLRRRRYERLLRTLAGAVVVIPGGTRGLGFALARELARGGAAVTVAGRDAGTVVSAHEHLLAAGLSVEARVCDVRDRVAVDGLIESVLRSRGRIDVLVNDAGVIEVGSVWDQAIDDFRESVETHIFGPLHTMRAVLPGMRARGDGRIVNIASIGGVIGVPHLAPYTAGKFGLVGLSQAYAAEVAHDGICVTTIAPGLMRTGSTDNASFKGRTRAEYAWFAVSDANPLLSASTGHAVRTIVRAIVARKTFVTITPIARAAMIVNALAPNLTTKLLTIAARLLPAPLDDPSVKKSGSLSHSPLAPSVLTALDRIAKEQNNE